MPECSNGIILFTPPQNPEPSTRFQKRFNDVAKELNIDLEWQDSPINPLAVDAVELTANSREAMKKYNTAYAQLGFTAFCDSAVLIEDVRRVLTTIEEQRIATVEKSAAFHERMRFTPSLEGLNLAEIEALYLFRNEVKPALDRIGARQENPMAPVLADWMQDYGDKTSRYIFTRERNDWCLGGPYVENKACSLFPFFPDRPPINGMIAPDISLEEFNNVTSSLPATDELLRPTTMVSRDDNGNLTAAPMPLHENFREDHLLLAKALEKIAALNIDGSTLDPALQLQLNAWAKFFRTGSAEDEAIAAQATIDAGDGGGLLRVHLGPSESYWEDSTKFPYMLAVGIRDREFMDRHKDASANFQIMENELGDIPYYTPRTLSNRGGVAEAIYETMTGGFLETFPYTDPGGYNFPNYTPYNTEGSNRFISYEQYGKRGQLNSAYVSNVTNQDLSNWDHRFYCAKSVIYHEQGHLLGPSRDHITPQNVRMGQVFGGYWGFADEPKADMASMYNTYLDFTNGAIDKDEVRNRLNGDLGSIFRYYTGKSQFKKEGDKWLVRDHMFGFFVEIGFFFANGAFKLATDKLTGKRYIDVDYIKLAKVGRDLFREIPDGHMKTGQLWPGQNRPAAELV